MHKSSGLRRLLLLLLILTLGLQICPIAARAEEAPVQYTAQTDLAAIIEPQIRVFADSIDQSNADERAAVDLAAHGMTGRGKTMNMGASSPLTATLMNSEAVQEGIAVIIADTIQAMQRMDMQTVPGIRIGFGWYGDEGSYDAYVLTETKEYPENLNWKVTGKQHADTRNKYDESLEWMVSFCLADAAFQCVGDTGMQKTYRLTVTFHDRFDFSTANTSGFKKLISGIGARLFREFDWKCNVTMDITIPYSYDHCSHASGAYHWIYDSESHTMICDSSGNYLQNDATHHTKMIDSETVRHYYELEKTVRLLHDKPWVLEYDVFKPERIVFAPLVNAVTKTYPQIKHNGTASLFAISHDYYREANDSGESKQSDVSDYSGTMLNELFEFSRNKTYTFRLENVISEDGSNRIYLTAVDTQTGEICVDRLPMDDHYYVDYGSSTREMVLISEESDWLSGKDIYISYIGTSLEGFVVGKLDLRIWENGQGNPQDSYWIETGNTATCTEAGYAQKACSRCGKTEQEDVPALGHTPGEAVRENETAAGYDAVVHCTACGEELSREYVQIIVPGDINGDGNVNNKDVACLFQYLSGWDVEVVKESLDVNRDGAVNNKDVAHLFQYLSGWDVEIK